MRFRNPLRAEAGPKSGRSQECDKRRVWHKAIRTRETSSSTRTVWPNLKFSDSEFWLFFWRRTWPVHCPGKQTFSSLDPLGERDRRKRRNRRNRRDGTRDRQDRTGQRTETSFCAINFNCEIICLHRFAIF